jgi:hypothetical protein
VLASRRGRKERGQKDSSRTGKLSALEMGKIEGKNIIKMERRRQRRKRTIFLAVFIVLCNGSSRE